MAPGNPVLYEETLSRKRIVRPSSGHVDEPDVEFMAHGRQAVTQGWRLWAADRVLHAGSSNGLAATTMPSRSA